MDADAPIPVAPPASDRPPGPHVDAAPGADGTAARGARVLVVEDDPGIAELLVATLADAGYRPTLAGDGRDALLKALDPEPFALALVDIALPVAGVPDRWGGAHLVARFHALGVPVVLLSALEPPPHVPAEVPFLAKPFSLDDLLGLVEECVEDGGLPEEG